MRESATTSSSADPTLQAVEQQLVERVATAPLENELFPYFYAESVFPSEFYAEMRRQLPAREAYKRISETDRTNGKYEQRLVLPLANGLNNLPAAQRDFWRDLIRLFAESNFTTTLLRKFAPTLAEATGKDPRSLQYGIEMLLVKDLHGYLIGPHTDVKSRAVSIMFYMPSSPRYEKYGTAIYRPNQQGMRSDGSRHFGYDGFTRVTTMLCRENSMFAFQRNDVSFHGVEPIDDPDCERDVLLYILRWRDPKA